MSCSRQGAARGASGKAGRAGAGWRKGSGACASASAPADHRPLGTCTFGLGAVAATTAGQTDTASATARSPRLPDLLVRSGSVTRRGDTLSGSVRIANTGRARARRSRAELAWRAGAGKPLRDVASFKVGSIKAGGRRSTRFRADIPAATLPGVYRAVICIDSRGQVRERNEKNNCHRVGRVRVPSAPPSEGPGPDPPAGGGPTGPGDGQGEDVSPPILRFWAAPPASFRVRRPPSHSPQRSPGAPLSVVLTLGGGSGAKARRSTRDSRMGSTPSWSGRPTLPGTPIRRRRQGAGTWTQRLPRP